jgi:hypothetical protein
MNLKKSFKHGDKIMWGAIMANYRTSLIGVSIIAAALYQMYESKGENTELFRHLISPEGLAVLVGGGFLLSKDAHNGKDDQ